MDISAWIQDRFGTDDTSTLLDESVYGRKELRKDKTKLEQNLRQIESEMDKHAERYQKLLRKGAEAEEFRRKQYAQKAKFEKKKYEVKKKKPIFRTPDLQVDQFSLWRLGQIMFEIKYYQLGVVDWID